VQQSTGTRTGLIELPLSKSVGVSHTAPPIIRTMAKVTAIQVCELLRRNFRLCNCRENHFDEGGLMIHVSQSCDSIIDVLGTSSLDPFIATGTGKGRFRCRISKPFKKFSTP
jgi:hypothetical protein